MKFDLVIGNPPYQLDNNKDFYRKFLENAKTLSDCVAMVIPSSYFGDTKMFDNIEHYCYNGMNFQNVELATSWFIWRRNFSEHTTIHFPKESISVKKIYVSPTKDKNNFMFVNNLQELGFDCWKIQGGSLWRKDAIPDDENGIWCIWTSGRANQDFDKSRISANQADFLSGIGKHKVVFTEITSHTDLGNIKYASPEYGCAGGCRYIPVDSIKQANILIDYLNSDFVRTILRTVKATSKHNTQQVFNAIPKIELVDDWQDQIKQYML